jgi:uncharacterized repeat protein (TIGR01451 family)
MAKVFLSFVCAVLGLLALPALAAGKPDVSAALEVKKVLLDAAGAESLQSADEARPGDTLQYVATYRNEGSAIAHDLQATIPIPAHTEFVPGSTSAGSVKASVDGSHFEVLPLKRKVKRADGKEALVLVPYSEYRFVRWSAKDLNAGQAVKYSTRVRVLADAGASQNAKLASKEARQ